VVRETESINERKEEAAVGPALLGGGIPLLPPPAKHANLKLTAHGVAKTGIVTLRYAVQ
jgi:hypothetical protein